MGIRNILSPNISHLRAVPSPSVYHRMQPGLGQNVPSIALGRLGSRRGDGESQEGPQNEWPSNKPH